MEPNLPGVITIFVITPDSDETVLAEVFEECVNASKDFPEFARWLGYHEEELFFGLKNLVATAELSAGSIDNAETIASKYADAVLEKLNQVQMVAVRKVAFRNPSGLDICRRLFLDPVPNPLSECVVFGNKEAYLLMSRGFVIIENFLDEDTVSAVFSEASASLAEVFSRRCAVKCVESKNLVSTTALLLPSKASGQGSAHYTVHLSSTRDALSSLFAAQPPAPHPD